MRIPRCIVDRLAYWAYRYMETHPISQVIPDNDSASRVTLIYRWDVFDLPGFHIRLHHLVNSDTTRDLHDHPWWNVTLLLDGTYSEVRPWRMGDFYNFEIGAPNPTDRRRAGDVVFRGALARHRIVLDTTYGAGGYRPLPAVSLFIHGRNKRDWGFWDARGVFTSHRIRRQVNDSV